MRAVRALLVSGLLVVCTGMGAPGTAPPVDERAPQPPRLCGSAAFSSAVVYGETPAPALERPRNHVDVYVHILKTPTTGGVSRARIKQQISVLNQAYAGSQSRQAAVAPFQFHVRAVDVTVSRAWWNMTEDSLEEARAKRALHRGDGSDLNLYIGRLGGDTLGWGTQPVRHADEPKLDGIVIARSTLPGGGGGHYSAGDAAVHESGHWLGLLHTFAGGCNGRGDHVADTPAEARPSYTCPVRRNTCVAPGRDPVHNFMDYSYDSCMNQFTHGQAERMIEQWLRFRSPGRPPTSGSA